MEYKKPWLCVMSTTLHYRQNHDVSVLAGVGPKRSKMLAQKGIKTVRQFLDADRNLLALPPKTYASMRDSALTYLGVNDQKEPTTTSLFPTVARGTTQIDNHSWVGLGMHMVRKTGAVVRVTVGPLWVEPSRVVLATSWHERGRKKVKVGSPVLLAALHLLWVGRDVVSEKSDSETPPRLLAPTCQYVLPAWEVPEAHAYPSVAHAVKEVRALMAAIAFDSFAVTDQSA